MLSCNSTHVTAVTASPANKPPTNDQLGSTLVVPACVVSVIDHPELNVYLVCSKELIKSAPAFKSDHGRIRTARITTR